MVILLFIFYHLDKRAYRKDIAQGRKPDISKPGTEFHIDGLHNIIFLVMIVAAVILSGVLPGLSAFQDAEGEVRGLHLLGRSDTYFPGNDRDCDDPCWQHFCPLRLQIRASARRTILHGVPFKEVAVLVCRNFYYHAAGTDAFKSNWTKSWTYRVLYQMFWATGALSSFLDNTPTYLVFLTTAGTLGFTEGITTSSWNCSGETSGGYFLWSCIYGSQYIYWKCTELYGKSDF